MTDPRAMEPGFDADDALAMDWALGALDAAERAAAEARRQADPAFDARCQEWAVRLQPMADTLTPVQPSAALWQRIDAAIGPAPMPPVPAAVEPAPTSGWWGNLGFWRGLSAAMAALALGLLLTRPDAAAPPVPVAPAPAPTQAQLATVLAAEGGSPLVTISVDPASKSAILAPVSAEQALEGRVPELWLIPADGTPRSLGVIDLGGTRRIAVPTTLLELVAEGAVLAVSLEPVGGSPTGAPTGPVVATGKLASI